MCTKRLVDFDGTLVEDSGWKGFRHVGRPIPEMVKKVRGWLSQGDEIILFTARLSPCKEFDPTLEGLDSFAVKAMLENWCVENLGQKLKVTNEKQGYGYFYDDWGIGIIRNSGLTFSEYLVGYLENLRELSVLDGEAYATSTLGSIIRKIKELE